MKKELSCILILFLFVFTCVSLFTYNAADPCVGHNFFEIPKQIYNAFGLFGAHLSGFFIYLFGLGAFWIPVVLLITSIWIFKNKSLKIIYLTLFGSLVLMISTGALLYLNKESYHLLDTTISSGGATGNFIAAFLQKYANLTGSVIILVFFFIMGFILTTGISMVTLGVFIQQKIVNLASTIAADFMEFVDYVKEKFQSFRERRIQKKEQERQKIEAALEQLPAKTPIKIPETTILSTTPATDPVNNDEMFEDRDDTDKNTIDLENFDPVIVEIETDDAPFQPDVQFEDIRETTQFRLPRTVFLEDPPPKDHDIDTVLLKEKARILEDKLKDFNVSGEVVEILPGPVITTFEYRPASGIKISKIAGLSDDLALALSAISIRIVAPIPGRDVVGIEIPNDERQFVFLKELVASKDFIQSESFLTLGLGKDILGRPVVTKMDSMPHLLIAGATGTGKSVGLNAMIISLLYKGSPDEIKIS